MRTGSKYSLNNKIYITARLGGGNIQFEAGSIGPSAARANTEAENWIFRIARP